MNKYDYPHQPPEQEMSLADRVKEAKANARSLEEVEQEEKNRTDATSSFLHGDSSLAEFSDSDGTRKEIPPGEVHVKSISELKACLEQVLPAGAEEMIEELVAHEARHFEQIQKVGWQGTVAIRFFRNQEGKTFFRCAVMPEIPESGDEEEIRQQFRSIIEAPDDPSDTDTASLTKK